MIDFESQSFDKWPLILTVPEAAKLLRIGRNSMYALVRAKKIHSIRIGRKIRISRDALMEYLSRKE